MVNTDSVKMSLMEELDTLRYEVKALKQTVELLQFEVDRLNRKIKNSPVVIE